MAKEKAGLLVSWSYNNRKISLDFLGGLNVITMILKNGRGRPNKRVSERNVIVMKEAGEETGYVADLEGEGGGPQAKECQWPLETETSKEMGSTVSLQKSRPADIWM